MILFLAVVSAYLLILGIGGAVAEKLFPKIPFIVKILHGCHLWDNETKN